MNPTDRAPGEPRPESTPTDAHAALAGLRILIVEDMGLIAVNLRSMLESLGCHVVASAARLGDATVLAQTETMDGVLLDLNLAGQYSYSITPILDRRRIPFILLSGYDHGHLRADHAAAAHLQKPITRDALEAMMLRTFV